MSLVMVMMVFAQRSLVPSAVLAAAVSVEAVTRIAIAQAKVS